MTKMILLLAALGYNGLVLAANPGWIYFQDQDNNDMRLLLTATCTDSQTCPGWIGVGLQQWAFNGSITFKDAAIQNQQWQMRDVFNAIPKSCLTITAPQTITFTVDAAGNTTVTCTNNKY